MKLLAKPVDMLVVFRAEARIPRPYKFKLEENGENILYLCQSTINGREKRFELKYYCSTCEWQLYKM